MSEVFRMLLWWVLSGLILVTIDLIVFRLGRKGWKRFVTTFLLFCCQIIVSQFILGLFRVLTSSSLVILNLITSLYLIATMYKSSGVETFRKYFLSLRQGLKSGGRNLRDDPLFTTLLILALLLGIWILFLGIIFPATDFDGNSYHLTFIAYTIQNHTFFDAPTSLTWLTGYPKGGEFIQMWTVLIPKSDVFVDLAQLPFLGLAVFSLNELALRLGISKRNARFAAILFVFLPIVINQLKTTYVDVMLSSLFFTSLAMVVQKKLSRLDLVLLGVVFSLIISIKSTGILFVVAVVPLLLYNLYKNRTVSKKKTNIHKSFFGPFLIIALPLVFGLYWYIKNWVLYGSPIYPFGFKILGHSLFPGQTFQEFAANAVSNLQALPKGCAERIWFVWTEQKDWYGCFYNYDTNYTGLGPIWFIVLLPAIFLSIYVAIKNKKYALMGVGVTILGLFMVYPTNYYSRYTMFITGLGILSLGLMLDAVSSRYSTLVKFLSILLVIYVILTNFTLCNFPPRTVKAQILNFKSNSGRGPIYDNLPGRAFVFLQYKIKPGDLVVYDSSPYFIYPLWRPDFSNRVEYIKSSDESEWLKMLRIKKTHFVFTTYYSRENKWAEKNLKRIYKDELYNVYQAN